MVLVSQDVKIFQFCNYFFFQCDFLSVVVYIDYYVIDYGNLEFMFLMLSLFVVVCCFFVMINKVLSDDGMFYI